MSEELAMYEPANAGNSYNYICTIDTASEDGQISVYNALSNARALSEYMDTPIDIVDVLQEPGIRRSRQVGVPDSPCVNTYLVAADGTAYFTQSDGVARCVARLLTIFKGGFRSTSKGCVRAKCVSETLRNGNTIKSLVLC